MFDKVSVKPDTKKKIKFLSNKYDVSIYHFVGIIVSFFYENRTIINADFFQKSDKSESESENKLIYKLEKSIGGILKKEIGRIIGFLRVQDNYMKSIKKDIIYAFSNGEIEDYHPLFRDYDYLIRMYKDVLIKKGLHNDKEIYSYIKDNFGTDQLAYFIESEEKIRQKKLFIDL